MYVVDGRILISLLVSFYYVISVHASTLLRRSTVIEESESEDNKIDNEFQTSNYIYDKKKRYSYKRIHAYCCTNQQNCAGLQFYENAMIEQWATHWVNVQEK